MTWNTDRLVSRSRSASATIARRLQASKMCTAQVSWEILEKTCPFSLVYKTACYGTEWLRWGKINRSPVSTKAEITATQKKLQKQTNKSKTS
jgi:hypothetical protein